MSKIQWVHYNAMNGLLSVEFEDSESECSVTELPPGSKTRRSLELLRAVVDKAVRDFNLRETAEYEVCPHCGHKVKIGVTGTGMMVHWVFDCNKFPEEDDLSYPEMENYGENEVPEHLYREEE